MSGNDLRTEIGAPLKSLDEHFNTLECRIQRSHHRSEAMGVHRNAERILDILDIKKLNPLLNAHAGLIDHAKLLFAQTVQFLGSKKALFVLTDARARILVLYSHLTNLHTAAQKGMCLGASLSEASVGTNAVSLALHDLESAIVQGPQHFSCLLQEYFCVTVPILGANGRLIGGLNISTTDADAMDFKLALMSLLAKDLVEYCTRNAVIDPVATRTDKVSIVGTEVRLTERQLQVLELYSQGLGYKQIAHHLQLLSAQTVQEHLDVVRVKLGATSRRDCIRKAAGLGFLGR